ncbi:MAG: putative rRNA maturation factor [Candidatus Wolfebacteria bacterium GW2011_GWC1_37_10]|nr:MAG: putative rRNA maturation factor [Candidatus Wolfebacteria bacterium GW2011_GWC1_37_10]
MKNRAVVASLDKRFNKQKDKIRKASLEILKILNQKSVLVEIYLASGAKMRILNRRFKGKDKPTDILSFPEPRNFPHPGLKLRNLGEIYLYLDYFRKNLVRHDYRYLLTHGILHLLGYDHKKKNDRIKMNKKEQLVIKKL